MCICRVAENQHYFKKVSELMRRVTQGSHFVYIILVICIQKCLRGTRIFESVAWVVVHCVRVVEPGKTLDEKKQEE